MLINFSINSFRLTSQKSCPLISLVTHSAVGRKGKNVASDWRMRRRHTERRRKEEWRHTQEGKHEKWMFDKMNKWLVSGIWPNDAMRDMCSPISFILFVRLIFAAHESHVTDAHHFLFRIQKRWLCIFNNFECFFFSSFLIFRLLLLLWFVVVLF